VSPPVVSTIGSGRAVAASASSRATISLIASLVRSIASGSVLGLLSGVTAAGESAGSPVPPTPNAPPVPQLPALGGGATSSFLLFGSIAALAVLLAVSFAQLRVFRRFAVEGGGPVGFALLLERPG
jgi:hypothetical protein